MMISDISAYSPVNQEKILVDTNVLIFIFCPIGNHRASAVKNYSSFISKAVTAKSDMYVTSQIISEFINVYFRIDFGIYRKKQKRKVDYKKDYRHSAEYKLALSTVKNIVNNQLLKRFKRMDDEFTNADFGKILSELDDIDHNDAYYADLLRGKDVSILTDDGDFSIYKTSHKILTANKKLIAA